MNDSDKGELVRLLTQYHQEQKEQSQGLPELKAAEEAAEIIIAELQGMDSGSEQMDLLMTTILRSDLNQLAYEWARRQEQRGRKLFRVQVQFLEWLGV